MLFYFQKEIHRRCQGSVGARPLLRHEDDLRTGSFTNFHSRISCRVFTKYFIVSLKRTAYSRECKFCEQIRPSTTTSSGKSSTLRVTQKSGNLSFTPSSRSTKSRACLKGLPRSFESTFCPFSNTKNIELSITCTC